MTDVSSASSQATAPPPTERAQNLSALGTVVHGFFGRQGGVSGGLLSSLNCGFGADDDESAVMENRALVMRALGLAPDRLVTVYQVHSPDVVRVESPWPRGDAPRADAMVTAAPGLGLGILTADCTPVLFADEAACVIGAAHAGWKGALSGVLEATVEAMTELGAAPERIAAAIGPTIGQANYEVGPEFKARFIENDPDTAHFFIPSDRADHHRFDLPAYSASRLARAGVRHMETLNLCTYAEETRFFSYRRATHRHEPDYGRNLSVIALRG